MLAIIRSYAPDFDSRSQRYMRSLKKAGIEYLFIGWARGTGPASESSDVLLFRRKGHLGQKWRNSFALFQWSIFVFATLWQRRKRITAVQAIDLDAGLAAIVFCKLVNIPMIFDLFDQYASSKGIGGLVGSALNAIERAISHGSSLIIIASAGRFVQHGISELADKVLVLENVPEVSIPYIKRTVSSASITLGYFGVLESHHRGIENLVELAGRRETIRLKIAGYGPLERQLKGRKDKNVQYLGPMSQVDGLSMLQQCDIVVGLYYRSNANHKYAAPNKYFEHLMLGRAMLTSQGTPPGDLVVNEHTGWAIGDTLGDLLKWADQLDSDAIFAAGLAARAVWVAKYDSYYAASYEGRYASAVASVVARRGKHAAG